MFCTNNDRASTARSQALQNQRMCACAYVRKCIVCGHSFTTTTPVYYCACLRASPNGETQLASKESKEARTTQATPFPNQLKTPKDASNWGWGPVQWRFPCPNIPNSASTCRIQF